MTEPRVLLDATAVPVDRGGVGRYIDALLPALVELGADLVVVCQPRDVSVVSALVPGVPVVTGPAALSSRPARLCWEQTGLPLLVRRVGAQVLHSPHYTTAAIGRFARTVTLHDATFFSHPQLHSTVKGRFFRSAIRSAVRSDAALVVPSRATAEEVARFTGASSDRFHVAHHGVDTAVFHPVDEAERRRVHGRLGLAPGESYVGFLGTLEPRKNVPALIRAWVNAVEHRPDPPALVLAGGAGWDPMVEPAVAAVPAGLHLVRTGYLPLTDLAGFLAGATILAYPSLGEGFGLPVLEAMACGAAVLTTSELSLPEVGGDAVAYTGVAENEIRDALRGLLDDGPRRRRLASAGVTRAAGFTWHEAARVHLEAYRAAAATTVRRGSSDRAR